MRIAVAVVVVVLCTSGAALGRADGHFVGRVVVEWVTQDGPDRDMRLLEDFALVDPAGKEWKVPSGARIDGASIPRVLWTAAGSPFTGDYRRASVVHDHYCDIKTEPWQEVHRMFYDGMIAGGVGEEQAKVFYAAVRFGGPRWEVTRSVDVRGDTVEVMTTSTRELSQSQLDELSEWVRTAEPGLDAIDRRVEQERTP
jgi:Protein of unknown function (DUF1353)